jgi:BlaI family transcriptional regulator, penicillinase repressor
MPPTPQDVTEYELNVLQVLWDEGPTTIRRITDVLYPGGKASQYATVQKLLERLEGKGFVVRDRGAAVHVFSATLSRDELIGRRLQSMAEELCGGSLTPLLTQLVQQSRKLSAAERQELRDLIDELDRPNKGKNPRR